MTKHAWERWRQRHPDLDPHVEFARARRAGKRLRLLLHGPEPVLPDPRRCYDRSYLITSSGVVFVVSSDGVVVTVLRLSEAKRRARALRRKEQSVEWVR